MQFQAIFRSIRIRPGTVYVMVGKNEIEIPRGAAFQDWLDSKSDQKLDMLIALALKEQLSIDPVLANAPAALEGKRVVVSVSIQAV